jgi:hypothetical protein
VSIWKCTKEKLSVRIVEGSNKEMQMCVLNLELWNSGQKMQIFANIFLVRNHSGKMCHPEYQEKYIHLIPNARSHTSCLFQNFYFNFHTSTEHQVVPVLSFSTEHYAMKMYWGRWSIDPHILDLSTRWRWVISFTPQALYPRERGPGSHWINGWVDTVMKRKIPSPCWTQTPNHPVCSPTL